MTVSIVIPTVHANDAMLQACLDILGDGEAPVFVEEGGTFAENCNVGAAKSASDIIVFLNDDIQISDLDWLDALIAPFSDESVGIVGCRLVYPWDGDWDQVKVGGESQLQHAGIGLTVDPGWNAYNIRQEMPEGLVHAVTGACLAIRRTLFNELGGFHEGYKNGAEDVELCLQAWRHGSTVWYTPHATLIHHESQSPGRWDHVNANIELFRSRWTFSVGVAFNGPDLDAGTGSPRS